MPDPWTSRPLSRRALTTAGVTALALPGALVALYVAAIEAASFFGEPPDADQLLKATLACWSAASVFAVAALCLLADGARLARLVQLLPGGLLATLALTPADQSRPEAPSVAQGLSAGEVGQALGTAWVVPTSWVLVVLLVVAVVRRVRQRA